MKRRQLLKAGLIGSAALAAGGAWVAWRDDDGNVAGSATSSASSAMQQRIERIVAAIAPIVLAGTLPEAPVARAAAVTRVSTDVGTVIATFTPPIRSEVHQLFSLLDIGITRWTLTGVADWNGATADDIRAFLERWRGSRIAMLQSGYHALHDLVFGAWYASDATWAELGYPGPPRLERSDDGMNP